MEKSDELAGCLALADFRKGCKSCVPAYGEFTSLDRRRFYGRPMWTRRAFTSLLAASSAVVTTRAHARARANGRRAEAAALRAFAETTHPRGREAAADRRWIETWDTATAGAETASDGAYFLNLWRGLSWFRDGHTTVLPFDFTGGVPDAFADGAFARRTGLRVQVRHDGVWVAEAPASSDALIGRRIEAINETPIADLMRRHVEAFPGEETWAHNWAGALFTSLGLLQGHDVVGADIDAPLRVQVLDESGGAITVGVPTAREEPERIQPGRATSRREAWALEAGAGNYVRSLPDGAIYVSIDDMADAEGMSFEALTSAVFAAMEAPQARRLVIDLRRNGGGNNFLGEALRRGVARSRFNRPGGLYVLISPATFSAAQNLATRLERETWAVFVGEPTGSSPNHYGDAEAFQGEASGITAIVSTIPWFDSYPMDDRRWIMPDLFAPMTHADWLAGRDAALDLALGHESDASPVEWSEARVFYFRRESQQARWAPFWRA